jgi:hypothetical protein
VAAFKAEIFANRNIFKPEITFLAVQQFIAERVIQAEG